MYLTKTLYLLSKKKIYICYIKGGRDKHANLLYISSILKRNNYLEFWIIDSMIHIINILKTWIVVKGKEFECPWVPAKIPLSPGILTSLKGKKKRTATIIFLKQTSLD